MTDPAVARARAVVGLYGDPTVSWSIGLDVSLSAPYDGQRLADRCAQASAAYPNLGRPARPERLTDGGAGEALRRILDTPYADDQPLVRVAHDSGRLLVAAHHGAVDGLGLLALLGLLLDAEVVSASAGIGARRSGAGFARSSMARLAEAAARPPTRLARPATRSRAAAVERGDVTAAAHLTHLRTNTSGVVAATATAFAEWNERHDGEARRLVAAVGASRRDGSAAVPDRDTAYVRLRLPARPDPSAVRRVLDTTDPEPAFPEGGGHRIPSLVSKALRARLRTRLGSSFLVSSLGLVTGPSGLEPIAFYPSAAGPRALAVGVASTRASTTVTVRLPRADFDATAAEQICALVAAGLAP